MKPPGFSCHRPESVPEALAVLAEVAVDDRSVRVGALARHAPGRAGHGGDLPAAPGRQRRHLSGWPFLSLTMAPAEGLAFASGDPVIDNVRRFGVYTLLTSTGSFDTGRAITRPAVLTTLRRAARKVRIDTRC